MIMTLLRNKEGRIRLTWKLAGILILSFIFSILMSTFIGFYFGIVGLEHHEAYIIGRELSLWFGQISILISTIIFAFLIDKRRPKTLE